MGTCLRYFCILFAKLWTYTILHLSRLNTRNHESNIYSYYVLFNNSKLFQLRNIIHIIIDRSINRTYIRVQILIECMEKKCRAHTTKYQRRRTEGNGGSRWLKLRGGVLRSPFLSLSSSPLRPPSIPLSPSAFSKRPSFLSHSPPFDCASPTRGMFVNSHLPPPPCGTNATPGEPYETHKSRGRAPTAGEEGEENAMEDERDGTGHNANRGGPENGNGTALRHSDTRARVKWRKESEKWSVRDQ